MYLTAALLKSWHWEFIIQIRFFIHPPTMIMHSEPFQMQINEPFKVFGQKLTSFKFTSIQ